VDSRIIEPFADSLNFQVSGDQLKSQQVDAPNFRAITLGTPQIEEVSHTVWITASWFKTR
jgi:hypothetical protein